MIADMTTLREVELGVLGPLQVRQRGVPVPIPGAKPRAILTMLGLHGGSLVPADTLVELLWGEDPPRTAAKAVQTHISALRRTLGDGFVLTQGTGWTLAETDVDASRYKLAARLGRDAAAAGDTSQAVARFEEALALWRGTPELPDGRRGTSEKTRWIEGHAALVEDRADALLATGRAAEIIGELEAAVAEAPLRERRWGQLMLALYRAGRQGEALGAYQRARAQLAEELGVDPGPELRRLEAAIVAQDASLDILVAQQLPSVTRAVTFLLTDIEGSTAAWEADADAMAVALARHDELVEQVVTSRGGRLIKTRGEGDATFSVFERPSAAAAAAIELQEAIGHERWALAEPMRIRVALHTGEVELRDGDYFGRAVNRAARLRSLAEGGQILCSGATAELVIDSLADDVVLADLGMRQLRNLPRPEHVFELRLETGSESLVPPSDAPMERPTLPAVLAGPGPFVGRGRELEGLLSAWQTALVGGMQAVLIAGEPGVGKTRLAGEWSRQAYKQGAVVLYGRCDEDLGAPYQPFAEALRSLVPCVGPDRLRGLRGVEALLPLVPGLIDVLPDLAAPTRADPDTERYALFDAVVALLGIASASTPVVLILDDLHWAAKPTLLLLRHLLRFGEHARVQIIGTYRSTDLDRSHPLAAMLADLHRDGTANRLQLSGLDEEDVTAYVAEAGYDDEELARALASVTGGNPFFLIEALRHVDESGGRWDPSTLPQGVREAVSRRLTRLAAETNKALAAAAVVGSRFALELVERVVDQDLVDAFDEACKAGIVIEESGGRYRFNHALVRQSLLAELPSVRRMRLHQRIATTLESQAGADDELLAELAYHYFECAWAGNAAKAVEYCRRAADQAMARLAYEGAADLYDRALHALEEIDDELRDRDDQVAELLIARCEALLAAGDVASAAGAVAQLQAATVDSARLAAWATCFDGQLSMLIHPERLDEAEAAVGAAAAKLAQVDDAAGEAKAHTVRAGCLARLGRIGDCEIALDDALTAARRAGEHRRVNAVLANAPLAALWGPNPVPRAGGRCLDVVRLLRITTDSPSVEATSTRCQAVLEAFRGRAEAARRMIDSARRMVTELGLRHALLEVEQFAGIVELAADDPAAAEPHLRKAYNGLRRMGLDADTAETAALLGRACLALNRVAEADELCSESQRLAGHALKASIAWRTLRAQLLSRGGDHKEARRVAEAAVALAERTDALVDHGDACLTLATVLKAAGDHGGARTAAERATDLYERKGAAALAEMARGILGERVVAAVPPLPEAPETPAIGLDNACVRVGERSLAAIDRGAWGEYEKLYATQVVVESRRKMVGFTSGDVASGEWARVARRVAETDAMRANQIAIAVRGERLALVRLVLGTDDLTPGAPMDEFLQLYAIDGEGRITLQVFFDIEDMDAALAELDAAHARFEKLHIRALETRTVEPDNACVRMVRQLDAAYDREAWEEIKQHVAVVIHCDSRRKIVGGNLGDLPYSEWECEARRYREMLAEVRYRHVVLAVRGERLALTRLEVGHADLSPGAPRDELLQLYGVDQEGRLCLQVWFDVEDIDAAIAELDATHARLEQHPQARRLENAAFQTFERMQACFATRDWNALADTLVDDFHNEDRRRVVNAGVLRGRDAAIETMRSAADLGVTHATSKVIATRGEHLVLASARFSQDDEKPEAFHVNALQLADIDADERLAAIITFDADDFDGAIAELDARYLAGEAAAHAHTWSVIAGGYAALNRHELPPTTPDFVNIDHRRGTAFAPGELLEYLRAGWDLDQDVKPYIESVHRLSDLGAVVAHTAYGTSHDGFDAEWREVAFFTIDGDTFNRCELFDEADIDVAIVRFDQLSRPTRRLENAATQLYERFKVCYAAHDWNAITEMLADNITTEDRRRVVNAGLRQGPDAVIAELSGLADVVKTITSEIIATRGARLALSRARTETHEAFHTDFLDVVEVDADGRAVARVVFDPDDFDSAIAELDARYLAGQAAAHARTWSIITEVYAGLNRHELPSTTPDWVNVDHRHVITIASGDLMANLRATWDIAPQASIYIEAVHRLNDLGIVVTHSLSGTSQEGFFAEWRMVDLMTFDGELMSRAEIFDEEDIDAALATFDRLSRHAPRLQNAASQVTERFVAHYLADDWDAMSEILADDFASDDRRAMVGAGVRHGRDAQIVDMRAVADLVITNFTLSFTAIRGERLALLRARMSFGNQGPEAFVTEVLALVEINADQRMISLVVFDLNDFDAAIAELDARYIAGETAAHAHTWSLIMQGFAALNRRELFSTTPDWVNIDHRRGTPIAPGEMPELLSAAWTVTSDASYFIDTVHRLNDLGAVFTHMAHETSQDGFHAEWRTISVVTFEGDLVNRREVFDEADVDAAITRFDQLSRSARRVENAASRMVDQFLAHFAVRDWDAMAEILADNISTEDRRRVVNAGIRQDRDAELKDFRSAADLGVTNATSDVIATRGERLVLIRSRLSSSDEESEAFHVDLLWLLEIDADHRFAAWVTFDFDDFDAAIAELDARYLAGEAAAHSQAWSALTAVFVRFNRHEISATTPDWVNIDHRRGIACAPGDMISYLRTTWDVVPEAHIYIEAVHRLSHLGAVVANVGYGTSQQGFDADWREIAIARFDGDLINRWEMFDEADLDAAIAKFDQLSRPALRLENTASQVGERYLAYFATRDWDAMTELLADNFSNDDRRRVVGSGVLPGRDAQIVDARAVAGLWGTNVTWTVMATRGGRLVLTSLRFPVRDQGPEAFLSEVLTILEIDADERIAALVSFDVDDIDAAFKELDARYLAGEAAVHAHLWSLVTGAYAALNRHELPSATPDWVNIDHRPVVSIEAGDLGASPRAVWALAPQATNYIEAVHQLSNSGTVVTHVTQGISQEGFEAEWRQVSLLTFDGDKINRCEVFEEADIDAAIARFEELNPQTRKLESAATQLAERFIAHFAARDWDVIAKMLVENFTNDDRRRVVGSGVRHGRDATMADAQAVADLWTDATSTFIAIRGRRLVLARSSFSDRDQGPEAFLTEALSLFEINADDKIAALVTFDPDDLDTAFEELDARYLAGEAAAYSHTWSVVSGAFAAINRHELPELTPDWVNIDHRRGAAFATGDMTAYIHDLWDDAPDINVYIEVVHRLSNLGAVITQAAHGTSQQGFQAEWREIGILTFDGDLLSRCELFDEADLDAALARFEELHPQAPRLENAASRAHDRNFAYFRARNWAAIAELLTDDSFVDDRRRVTSSGFWDGRDVVIANLRALADAAPVTWAVVATRGERLAVTRICSPNRDLSQGEFSSDMLILAEIDTDGRIAAQVPFDVDDVDAAFEELDRRYLAGEAAAHAHTWSVVSGSYAAMNRNELFATTPDWVNADRRRHAILEEGGLNASLRSLWELVPDIKFRVETVHRLTDLGAVTTHVAHGVSQHGFHAEWRGVEVHTVDGDLINRCEIFDEADLDVALAHFDELHPQARRLENTASRAVDRFLAYFAAGDWDAMRELLADNFSNDDRRPVVGAGARYGREAQIADMRATADVWSTHITATVMATRGERLVLMRHRFRNRDQGPEAFLTEILGLLEIDADGRAVALVSFDANDFDAAVEELDARYLAGEAAAHSRTWSVITSTCAALNRRELFPTTPDWVSVDHRPGIAFKPGDLTEYIRAAWNLLSDGGVYLETVHRLSHLGAVVTWAGHATSPEGFDAEFRGINLLTVEGDLVSRCEIFEEADLDAALAKFEELHPQAPRLENAASQVDQRFWQSFAARDWDAMAALLVDDVSSDDRRRVVNAGALHGRDVHIESMRALGELDANMTSAVIATRGERLALTHWNRDVSEGEFGSELLYVIEIDADHRIAARVFLDAADLDAAVEELDARYLAGEAATHAHTWSVVARAQAGFIRHELPATTPNPVFIDHRPLVTSDEVDMAPYLRAVWDLIPDVNAYIEAVHRLSDLGAVVTQTLKGTSREGFDAEWRMINIFTVEDELISRCETFDETALHTALARFDELHPQARLLENAAIRAWAGVVDAFNRRDGDALLALASADIRYDDRRKGLRHVHEGPERRKVVDVTLETAPSSWRLEVKPIAIRGSRLSLTRGCYRDIDDADRPIAVEMLHVMEVGAGGLMQHTVNFDVDDIDAAFEELDARYLSGEAAAHAHTWSVIAETYAALNRRELPPTAIDWVDVDHRRGTPTAAGDLIPSVRATWDLMPDFSTRIEVVHRLSALGAVITNSSSGTSHEGFDAEWRMLQLVTVEGDRINRCEVFDETDLDAALARFEELLSID